MSEEWGPWIEHDGKGCPVKGMHVVAQYWHMGVREFKAVGSGSWKYGSVRDRSTWTREGFTIMNPIIRYRVRRPKALQQLIQMVENLPVPSKQYKDA